MAKKNICNCVDCDEGWANFKVLTDKELVLLEHNRYEADFRSGEMIIKQLSPASNAVFLRSGMAKESIVRILKDFSDEGIICSVCLDIEIIDKDKLQMISDNG